MRATVIVVPVVVGCPVEKPDEGGKVCSGRMMSEVGTPDESMGFMSVKSWVLPRVIGGTGFALPARILAVPVCPPPAVTKILRMVACLL